MGKFGTGYEIGDAKYYRCGNMICKKCNTKIKKGEFLVVKHYNSGRGNEDDYNELFHKDCSKDKKYWKEYYDKKAIEYKRRNEEHHNNIEKAIKMLKNSKEITFETNEYNENLIIIN